jgi:hypothetical protein
VSNTNEPGVRAIETFYAGCRFRSRLEARWAVFFDTLGVEWQYEPEGYVVQDYERELPGIWPTPRRRLYLPDFYLPAEDVHVEVKGSDEATEWPMWGTAVDGASASGLPDSRRSYGGCKREGGALLILGPIPERPVWHPLLINRKGAMVEWVHWRPSVASLDHLAEHPGIGWGFWFDVTCGGMVERGYCEGPPPSVVGRPTLGADLVGGHPRDIIPAPTLQVSGAYRAARSARFEHGERGR